MSKKNALALAAVAALAGVANAAVILETEANDSKATANPAALTATGDTIVGNSTGTSTTVAGPTSADYFLVSTPAQSVGVYRNRLSLGATQNNVGTIRGLGQTGGTGGVGPGIPSPTALDNSLQSNSASTTTPARFNQWYTFGPAASLYYRVTGATSTTADYTATYSQEVITPVNLGTYNAGLIELTNTQLSSTQDTEVFVYDAATGVALPGYTNDDFLDGTVTQTSGSALNSRLVRTYGPGTYLLAISSFNTADSQLSPADEGAATGTYLDFAGVMANSSTTLLPSIPFNLIDGPGVLGPGGSHPFTASKPGAFDIYFATFTVVVPEPTSLAALGLLGVIARRRRI